MRGRLGRPDGVPCTCGLYCDFEPGATPADRAATTGRLNYGLRHGGRLPPARWEQLAQARATAQKIADACGPLDGRVFLRTGGFTYNSLQPTWYPYVLCLSSAPVAQARLSHADASALLELLSQIVNAGTADYSCSGHPLEDELSQWTEDIDDLVSSWEVAQEDGDTVDDFVAQRMQNEYNETEPWASMDAAAMTAALGKLPEAPQHLLAVLRRHTRCHVVIEGACTAVRNTIAGLTLDGFLVGATILSYEK